MVRPGSGSHHAPPAEGAVRWPLVVACLLAVASVLASMALSGSTIVRARPDGLPSHPLRTAALVSLATPAPVKVAVFGDSLTTQSFPMLATDLSFVGPTALDVQNDSFPGTAPCDWQTPTDGRPSMSQVESSFHPDVVVLEFVGNNGTSCINGAGSAGPIPMAWQYATDLGQAITMFEAAGVSHIIVVGGPAIAPSANFSPAAIQGWIRFFEWAITVVANTPRVTWIDGGASVDQFMGGYTSTLPCAGIERWFGLCVGLPSMFGPAEPVRADDGIHLCDPGPFFNCTSYSSGAWRFAGDEARAIEALYGLGPAPLL